MASERLFICLLLGACMILQTDGKGNFVKIREPFGIKMCSSLCSTFGKCSSLTWDKERLRCLLGNTSVLSAGVYNFKLMKDVVLNLTWYRKILTKKKGIIVVQEYLRTKGFSSDADDGYIHLSKDDTHLFVKQHDERKTWSQALQVCKAEGGTLVKVDSKVKQKLLIHQFLDNYQNGSEHTWIGLRDSNHNDIYRWGDGSFLGPYTNWGIREPNYAYKGKTEDCVAMNIYPLVGTRWYDIPCNTYRKFVCEKSSI